jgi:hypothetical protein
VAISRPERVGGVPEAPGGGEGRLAQEREQAGAQGRGRDRGEQGGQGEQPHPPGRDEPRPVPGEPAQGRGGEQDLEDVGRGDRERDREPATVEEVGGDVRDPAEEQQGRPGRGLVAQQGREQDGAGEPERGDVAGLAGQGDGQGSGGEVGQRHRRGDEG